MKKFGARFTLAVLSASLVLAGTAHAVTYTVSFGANGGSENPPTTSTATGNASMTINTDTNQINYSITHNVVGPSAAHIHGPAARDKNAGVLIGFPSAVSPMAGTLNYVEANEADILAGRMYVNIHNAANPGGDIRGQLPAAPQQAPSMSEWGMMVLAAALLAVGGVFVTRRRRAMA